MAAQTRLSLHLSKGHIVGNHMSQLIFVNSRILNNKVYGLHLSEVAYIEFLFDLFKIIGCLEAVCLTDLM